MLEQVHQSSLWWFSIFFPTWAAEAWGMEVSLRSFGKAKNWERSRYSQGVAIWWWLKFMRRGFAGGEQEVTIGRGKVECWTMLDYEIEILDEIGSSGTWVHEPISAALFCEVLWQLRPPPAVRVPCQSGCRECLLLQVLSAYGMHTSSQKLALIGTWVEKHLLGILQRSRCISALFDRPPHARHSSRLECAQRTSVDLDDLNSVSLAVPAEATTSRSSQVRRTMRLKGFGLDGVFGTMTGRLLCLGCVVSQTSTGRIHQDVAWTWRLAAWKPPHPQHTTACIQMRGKDCCVCHRQ